jgi:hypothetical protein
VWLPVDAAEIETVVLATERRLVAISARHPLADRQTVEFSEIVSSGAAVTLLAEGNADIYSRGGIVCVPVSGLEPARLAIAWRRGDRRPAARGFVQACREAADT